jgi:hypothetical protein
MARFKAALDRAAGDLLVARPIMIALRVIAT